MSEEMVMEQEFKLPQEWFEEGKELLEKGSLSKARKAFEQALELDPYYPQALSGLSKVYWQEGKFRESVEKINEALMIDPDDPEVIEQCANIFMAVGQKEDALDVLRAYSSRNPWDDDVKAMMERIQALPESTVRARISDSSGSDQFPLQTNDTADIMVREGENQYSKGNTDRARVCFEIALEHNPAHARAHNNLGVILWEAGNTLGALEHFQQAFHENPFDRDIVFNSFNALVAAGFLEEARDLIKLHIQQNPGSEEAWQLYDEVSLMFSRISWTGDGLSPEVGEIYTSMGKKLLKSGDLYGAAEAFHKALAIDPGNKKALKRLARLHRSLGHVDESLGLYQELLEQMEGDEKVAIEYADYLVELGRRDEALNFLEGFKSSNEVISKKITEIRG